MFPFIVNESTLSQMVNDCFGKKYEVSNGTAIPKVEDIGLDNAGRKLNLAMLFVDIRGSTKLVDFLHEVTAAKMYKSFLQGVTRIIRKNGGYVRSFNGDGVLAAFIGDKKCTQAVTSALQISWFCSNILKPKVDGYLNTQSNTEGLKFNFGIGVDVGEVLVVRGGYKGTNNNDLVWVGNATNYAVKLSARKIDGYNICISKDVYKKTINTIPQKTGSGQSVWHKDVWPEMGNLVVYVSDAHWGI